ncbi:phage tail assembly chaperone [Pantoea ananatis]|uniref:phage tail assembly chaperone n=1 Tax=Pantoea ananas TaxID=553 RepID=UPI000241733E|nr:hypothetical protein [Pantoea ananatis]UEG19771.1 hypothetical protein LLG94_10460 [Pantoea ananatis]CCF09296.1 putative bacteriophage protein [Pantoea ananatis LMG 5342]
MQFEIKGIRYSAHKLSVFDQLKVSRKLLPVLAGMLGDFQAQRESSKGGNVNSTIETVLPKIADAVAGLSEEDTNAIIFPCLAVVQRAHGKDRWVPVMQGNDLAFDDIDLFSMLQIVGRVVGDSLGNFLPALPEKGTEGQQPQG